MVSKMITDLDLESSSSDSDDQDDNESVFDDHARTIWKSLAETIEKIDDMLVVDKAFMPGDVVGCVSDPSGQTGTVVDVNIMVDLKTATGELIRDINSKTLVRVCPFMLGDYVISGSWLGRIDYVVHNVTVLFGDNATCKIRRAGTGCLMPVSQNFLEDERCPYHPGQRVRCNSFAVFKNADWIHGSWSVDKMEGTVISIEAGPIYVSWIVQAAPPGDPQSLAKPVEEQDPENLTLLSCFSFTSWRLGDWCLIHTNSKNTTFSGKVYEHDLQGDKKGSPDKVSVKSRSEGCEKESFSYMKDWKSLLVSDNVPHSLLVTKTKTKVDVVWQDGTKSFGLDSRTLFPVDNMGYHDFWPEQFVVEKGQDEDNTANDAKRVAIVKSVDAKERTVKVKWFKKLGANTQELDKEEIVSVYELSEHPDFNFCIGDIVIRLFSVEENSDKSIGSNEFGGTNNCCHLKNLERDDTSVETIFGKNDLNTVHNLKDGVCKENSALSSIGSVIGLEEGLVKVGWADGKMSKVAPQMIVVAARDEYQDDDEASSHSDSGEETHGDQDETTSCGTFASDYLLLNENDPQVEDGTFREIDSNLVCKKDCNGQNSGYSSLSQTAFGFVARIARGFFGLQESGLMTEPSNERENKQLSNMEFCNEKDSVNASENQLHAPSLTHSFISLKTIDSSFFPEGKEAKFGSSIDQLHQEYTTICTPSSAADNYRIVTEGLAFKAEQQNKVHKLCQLPAFDIDSYKSFEHFSSVKDPMDHFFLAKDSQSPDQRQWMRKVQQEWAILEKGLPDGIYVQVYEDRIDLLRAVIIGAAGTPYQDGLFFFDIYFPPDYPRVPPQAHYHSAGLRLNPNLYEDGKICLSLLNTWTGKGNEVWDPTNSSILQLLVSLQGLVLNAKPYFNEAGYDKQIGRVEGEKNSLAYNENSFLLSCKSMLHHLRKPPKHFEDFIKNHFQKRGGCIIRACNAYMMGFQVGCLSEDAEIQENQTVDILCSNSNGFKIMLAKLIPKLMSAFHEIGSVIEDHNFSA